MDKVYLKLSKEIKEIIRKEKPKTVLLQAPSGLKKYLLDLSKEIDSEVYIWGGTCFGACDIPNVKVDLLIQIGHNAFIRQLPPL